MKKFLIVSLSLVFLVPFVTSADTLSDLQAQVIALTAQVQQLIQQLAQMQGGTTAWCHTFNTDLQIGNSGTEVSALTSALIKNGISVTQTSTFDENVASAVSSFQQKYTSDVLTPAGLSSPTGYVGSRTRTKLNALYGCGTQTTATGSDVQTAAGAAVATSDNTNNNISCSTLWYFDSNSTASTACGQKQFCGQFMYQGLQTFADQSACQTALVSVSRTSCATGFAWNAIDNVCYPASVSNPSNVDVSVTLAHLTPINGGNNPSGEGWYYDRDSSDCYGGGPFDSSMKLSFGNHGYDTLTACRQAMAVERNPQTHNDLTCSIDRKVDSSQVLKSLPDNWELNSTDNLCYPPKGSCPAGYVSAGSGGIIGMASGACVKAGYGVFPLPSLLTRCTELTQAIGFNSTSVTGAALKSAQDWISKLGSLANVGGVFYAGGTVPATFSTVKYVGGDERNTVDQGDGKVSLGSKQISNTIDDGIYAMRACTDLVKLQGPLGTTAPFAVDKNTYPVQPGYEAFKTATALACQGNWGLHAGSNTFMTGSLGLMSADHNTMPITWNPVPGAHKVSLYLETMSPLCGVVDRIHCYPMLIQTLATDISNTGSYTATLTVDPWKLNISAANQVTDNMFWIRIVTDNNIYVDSTRFAIAPSKWCFDGVAGNNPTNLDFDDDSLTSCTIDCRGVWNACVFNFPGVSCNK